MSVRSSHSFSLGREKISSTRLVNDFDVARWMHEVQIEVDLGSAASAKAVLKSGIVVAVIAFGKRRGIWFGFVVGKLRHNAVPLLVLQVAFSAHSERNIFVRDLGRTGISGFMLVAISTGPIAATAVLV